MLVRIKINHPNEEGLLERSQIRSARDRFWVRMAQREEIRRGLRRESRTAEEAAFTFSSRQGWATIESQIQDGFPGALESQLTKRLGKLPRSESKLVKGTDLNFTCFDISYGSLELLLAAVGLEKYSAAIGISIPFALSVLEASVPDALRDTMYLQDDVDFDVEADEVPDTRDGEPRQADTPASGVNPPSIISTSSGQEGAASPKTKVDDAKRAVSLLLASYLVPIGLAAAVFYIAETASNAALKRAEDESAAILTEFAHLTSEQTKSVSEERIELAKLASAALKDAQSDRQVLAQSMIKLATDVNQATLQILYGAASDSHKPLTTTRNR